MADIKTLAVVPALLLALVACGGGSDEAEPTTTTSSTTTTVVPGSPVADGVVTSDEAQRICTQEYDTIVVPYVDPVPDRTTYVDDCVVGLTSDG